MFTKRLPQLTVSKWLINGESNYPSHHIHHSKRQLAPHAEDRLWQTNETTSYAYWLTVKEHDKPNRNSCPTCKYGLRGGQPSERSRPIIWSANIFYFCWFSYFVFILSEKSYVSNMMRLNHHWYLLRLWNDVCWIYKRQHEGNIQIQWHNDKWICDRPLNIIDRHGIGHQTYQPQSQTTHRV